MKEDRNTSQNNVEEFGNKQATLVGYIEAIEDILVDLSTIRSDLIEQKDVGDLPTNPGMAYYLGLLEMEEKTLEICRFRLSKANQLKLKLCEDVRRTSKHDS